MVNIQKIDHIGIRVKQKQRSIAFYEKLGFALIADSGFEQGHPIMMRHACGIVLNLLGPATEEENKNILMDSDRKHPGYTHMALKVASLTDLETFLKSNHIEITGRFSFKGMSALFIRDPDRNVIEFDAYAGRDPVSRQITADEDISAYQNHP